MPWYQQVLRPMFLAHLIFSIYMALSSIFYFMDINGYYYFEQTFEIIDAERINLAAEAQQYYLLGHAGMAHGLILFSQYENSKVPPPSSLREDILVKGILILSGGMIIFNAIPGLRQFGIKLSDLSFTGSILLLSIGIQKKKLWIIVLSGGVFIGSLYNALLSGWKEAILLPFILLSSFLFPKYRRGIILLGGAFMVFFITLMPTFNESFRKLSWESGINADAALNLSYEHARTLDNNQMRLNTWIFLRDRFSEIGIFVRYLKKVPEERDFYNFTIIQQGMLNLIPRAIYPDKPDTEKLVMERVYENEIISYHSQSVSAKPQYIVDGYLSFGRIGIWIFGLALGAASARISVLAEHLFGGYWYGTAFIYTGLFQVFWKGNCFEFMLNTVFWGLIIMLILFKIFNAFSLIPKSSG